jgi:signal transduction histidine kinase
MRVFSSAGARGPTVRVFPCGLDPEKTSRRGAVRGVVGMMERVAFFGGTFSLAAAPEGGSVLQVLLPGGNGGRI